MTEIDEHFIRSFETFVLSEFEDELMKILEGTDERIHHSVLIKFPELIVADSELCHGILANPNHYLLLCDKGLVEAQKTLYERQTEELKCELLIKTKVHAQFTELPDCPELHRTSFPTNEDLGNFLRVSGTVVRVTSPKVLEFQRDYMCSKCKHIFTVKADYEMYYIIPNPYKCRNPDGCNGSKIIPIKGITPYNCKDYQEIKIQEQVSKLDIGCMPRSMWVTLEDNIVDTCKPGDDISVCGTVMRRWKPLYNEARCDIEIVIKGNYVEVSNDRRSAVIVTQETHKNFSDFWTKHADDPLRGRNLILASFCPEVFGLHIVKLALCLVLAGGVHKVDSIGNRIRGASHLLLVGDPATGKSHLMRFAAKVSPRSVVTSGVGTTSAGLTVCAVKDNGIWQLEAGALVLSDGGICCIDEFGCIKEHDRTSIHEAMEQQTISVAKAGIVCKLNTRCSIIATTNTSGDYDPEHANCNVSLSSPLLSRFDLVLTLMDSHNEEWDQMLSTFIIEGRDPLFEFKNRIQTEDLWDLDKLRAYFCIIKHIKPVLTSEAGTILTRYYQAQRQAAFRNAARTTVRLLESLVRLSQAHARFMFRDHVTVQDTVIAIILMEYSMQSQLLGVTSTLHASFSEDPTKEYRNQVQIILQKLELEDILEKELHNLEKNLETSAIKGRNNKAATYLTHDVVEAEFQLQPEIQNFLLPTSKSVTEQLSQVFTGIRKAKETNACKTVEFQLTDLKKKVAREETSKRKTRDKDLEYEFDTNKKLPRIQMPFSNLDTNTNELIDFHETQISVNDNTNHLSTQMVSEPEINNDISNIKAKFGLSNKFPDKRITSKTILHTVEIHNISTTGQNEGTEINNPSNTIPPVACASNHVTTKINGKIFNNYDTETNSQVETNKNLASLIKFGKKLTGSQAIKSTQWPTNSLDSSGSDLLNDVESTNRKTTKMSPVKSFQPELQKTLNVWGSQTQTNMRLPLNLHHEAFDDNDLDI